MITLQQASGDNNETIWCLRLRGEGSNLVTLGDFSADTGWTMTGDWAIGSGVATYTYVDDATGALYRTLSAASAVGYILEYEVTAKSGQFWALDAADLTVMGGGSYFFANGVRLDSSVGKHTIQMLGNAGGTELRFTITDTGATDTISIDNVNIRVADNVLYLSTRDITLNNTYDGQILNQGNYLTDLNQNSSIAGSGGTGSVSSFSLSISRYVSNAGFSSFFNNFYPATGTGYLTSKVIDFGICWVGATTDTEITWLFRGRVIDYSYEQRQLNLTIFQESEISNKEVPYYTVQKDFDNEISYFTNAPEESYGRTIPIVYGNLSTSDNWGASLCVPCVYVDQSTLTIIAASHYVSSPPSVALSYISEVKSYLEMTSSEDSASNTYAGCLFSLQSSGTQVYGKLYIKLGIPNSFASTSANVLDAADTTNYLELDTTDRLDLSPIGIVSNSKIAALSSTLADIGFHFVASSDGAGDRIIEFSRYNLSTNTGTSVNQQFTVGTAIDDNVMYFATSTDAKNNANIPWKIDEVCSQRYRVQNTDADSGDIVRIYYGYIVLDNIKLQSIVTEYKVGVIRSKSVDKFLADAGSDYVVR